MLGKVADVANRKEPMKDIRLITFFKKKAVWLPGLRPGNATAIFVNWSDKSLGFKAICV